MYELQFNKESTVEDRKHGYCLLHYMRFEGTKSFIPQIINGILFFTECGNDDTKWWHGWLKGIPFISGWVGNQRYDFIYVNRSVLINVENSMHEAAFWTEREIQFASVSIDIGGEELMII